jgi:hypothetical protein
MRDLVVHKTRGGVKTHRLVSRDPWRQSPVDAVDERWSRLALRLAAERGVRDLLARGADPNARDSEGSRALDVTDDEAIRAILQPLTRPVRD